MRKILQFIVLRPAGTDPTNIRIFCYSSKTLAHIPIICLQGYLHCLKKMLLACLHLGKRTVRIIFTLEPQQTHTHRIKYIRIDILHTFRFDFYRRKIRQPPSNHQSELVTNVGYFFATKTILTVNFVAGLAVHVARTQKKQLHYC